MTLHGTRTHPELVGERRGQVDLEADQVVRIHRILKHVGSAALRIRPPAQLTARTNTREPIGRGLIGGAAGRGDGEQPEDRERHRDPATPSPPKRHLPRTLHRRAL